MNEIEILRTNPFWKDASEEEIRKYLKERNMSEEERERERKGMQGALRIMIRNVRR